MFGSDSPDLALISVNSVDSLFAANCRHSIEKMQAMSALSSKGEVPVLKNESENAVPTCWRPVLREIVDALAANDFALVGGVLGVERVSSTQAEQIQSYVADYGAKAVTLPEEAWETSVCMWNGGHSWDVLVDLWTQAEGRSDLVLSVRVTEQASGFAFKIHMVYVP